MATPEQTEAAAARAAHGAAVAILWRDGVKLQDMEACAIAALARAFEDATPEWSREARARFFGGDDASD